MTANAKKIDVTEEGQLLVPDTPIIPFIEGDGIGVDVTPAMKAVVDAHGGSIEVASTLNQGSRFSVFLPGRPATEA